MTKYVSEYGNQNYLRHHGKNIIKWNPAFKNNWEYNCWNECTNGLLFFTSIPPLPLPIISILLFLDTLI